jgi:hypothetical protein
MRPALVQRQAALAGAALLATLGVLAFTDRGEEPAPIPPVEASVRWQRATVGILPPEVYARQTTCGVRLDSGTLGVAHPVLPCGVDLVVGLGSKEVRTEVVERGPVGEGRDFDLTQALARELGLRRTDAIRWHFAG